MSTLTIYYTNKDPTEVSSHAKYITDIQDLNSNNWKHLKSVYAVGDYGDNTITLSWTKYPTYENWQQLVGKTSDYTTYGDVPVWYNLGQARRSAFMLQWTGDSQINHEAVEVTYNIKTQ